MCDLLSDVKNYIRDHDLIEPHTIILVGVSGGADSISLLHILHRLHNQWPFKIHIAHLNHQLRPDAQQDADFVAQVANTLKLPYSTKIEDVAQIARKEKRTIEEAARHARRTFLLEIAQKIGASRIALGHTKSDQAETILFRLLRGTGPTGLAAMRPITNAVWIRPLLDVSRSQIEAYAKHHNLAYCTDSSNTDLRFARNKIRHQLLPHLKTKYAPQIESALTRLGTITQDEDALLEKLSQEAFQKATLYCANQKIILDVKQIFGYHISLRRRLLKKALFGLGISEKRVTFDIISRLLKSLSQPQTHIQITANLSAHQHHGLLIITRPTTPFQVSICPLGETVFPIQNARIHATQYEASKTINTNPSDAYTAFFDAHQMPSSFYIREIQPGDKFHPFGLDGTQKISKLLVDLKIPRPLRGDVPVLVGNDKILWVLGLRRSNIAPITSKTTHIQKLIFEGGWQRIITHPETR